MPHVQRELWLSMANGVSCPASTVLMSVMMGMGSMMGATEMMPIWPWLGVAPAEEGAVDGDVKGGGGCVSCRNGHDAVGDFDGNRCCPVFEFGVSPCPQPPFGIDVEAVMGACGKVMSVFGARVGISCPGWPDVGLPHPVRRWRSGRRL